MTSDLKRSSEVCSSSGPPGAVLVGRVLLLPVWMTVDLTDGSGTFHTWPAKCLLRNSFLHLFHLKLCVCESDPKRTRKTVYFTRFCRFYSKGYFIFFITKQLKTTCIKTQQVKEAPIDRSPPVSFGFGKTTDSNPHSARVALEPVRPTIRASILVLLLSLLGAENRILTGINSPEIKTDCQQLWSWTDSILFK